LSDGLNNLISSSLREGLPRTTSSPLWDGLISIYLLPLEGGGERGGDKGKI